MRSAYVLWTVLLLAVCVVAEDFYSILGVPRDATDRQIKKAYRQLSAKWHPDKATTPEDKKLYHEKFLQISRANQVLSDPQKRRHYDLTGEDPDSAEAQQRQAANPFGFGFMRPAHGIRVNFGGFDFGGFGFDFGEAFGQQQHQRGGGFGGARCVQSVTCRNGVCTTTTTCQG